QGLADGYTIRSRLQQLSGNTIDNATARKLYVSFVDKARGMAKARVKIAGAKFALKDADYEESIDRVLDELDGQNPGAFLEAVGKDLRARSNGNVHPTPAESVALAKLLKIEMDSVWIEPRKTDEAFLDRILSPQDQGFRLQLA